MRVVRQIRLQRGISQRKLAARAGVAFRTVQLIETDSCDPRLSTLGRIGAALGYPEGGEEAAIAAYWSTPEVSVCGVSRNIREAGEDSWKLWLFEFVDSFRRRPDESMMAGAPCPAPCPRVLALLAATVETLCDESGMRAPWWTAGVDALPTPWFVSECESLKALALAESPVHFRKRNIFVLGNFLARV